MDADMMRHWGHRSVMDNRPYGDASDSEEDGEDLPEGSTARPRQSLLRGLSLVSIAEESSSQDVVSNSGLLSGLGEEEEEDEAEEEEDDEQALRYQSNNKNKNKEDQDNNKDDQPVGDQRHEEKEQGDNIQSAPLHSAFGQFAEDLMLNNSMASPTGGKYRTVSVFGGVFAMPEDPVDSDNLSLSSESDGFSSDEEDFKPVKKRSPQRKVQRVGQTTTTKAPRVVSPPSSPRIVPSAATDELLLEKDTTVRSSSALTTPTTSSHTESSITSTATAADTSATEDDISMTRALQALDQTGSLLKKVLGELEASSPASSSSSPFYGVEQSQVMENAISTLQVSKQTLESAICLEDSLGISIKEDLRFESQRKKSSVIIMDPEKKTTDPEVIIDAVPAGPAGDNKIPTVAGGAGPPVPPQHSRFYCSNCRTPYDLPNGSTSWRCASCHTFNSTTPDQCPWCIVM